MKSRSEVLNEVREKVAGASSLTVLQEQILKVLAKSLAHYAWTGFYMLDPEDPDTLVVGPYIGDPTPHIRIPVSQGICGAAVATGKTVIVDDVGSDPRYLSCSIETKSEIVVPIYASGRIIGEIDIDSHDPAAFTGDDRDLLEEVARIVGNFIENHSETEQN
jgi:L-methionine (R)-S-oxide reductase